MGRADPRPVTVDPGRTEYARWYNVLQRVNGRFMVDALRQGISLLENVLDAQDRGASIIVREKDGTESPFR